MVMAFMVVAFSLAEFLGEIAITETIGFQSAFLGAVLRGFAVFMVSLFVITSMVRELNDKGLELVLSLPIPRASYFLGKLVGFSLLAGLTSLLCSLCLLIYVPSSQVALWGLSLALELLIVTAWVLVLLVLGLVVQGVWHWHRPGPKVNAQSLPAPPSIEALRIASVGDPWVSAKVLVIWLQAFDNQPGISIPFRDLDYDRVQGWLTRSLQLDPRGQYPLLAASRLYGAVPFEDKKRQMLDFVHAQFLLDPDGRWQWLAHAAIIAKHQLGDIDLALEYAQDITKYTTADIVPGWARHMSVIVLEDMGELEAALRLTDSLLKSGLITDPHEIRFLARKLEELNTQAATDSQE